jgi:hypothetical protein
MSNQDLEKREAAMRLFGALSGVDEEYLAACEGEKTAGTSVPSKVALFARRHGRAVAAVLCLAVLGAGYLGVRMTGKDAGATQSMQSGSTAMNGAGVEMLAQEAAEEENAEETGKTAKEAAADNGAVQTQGDSEDALTTDQSIDSQALKYVEMTEEQAAQLAVVGAFMPTHLPVDGKPTSLTGCDTPGQEKIRLEWAYANTWDSFFVTISNLGTMVPDWVQESLADVSKPETYDENLYEIPYSETVPQEYWSVFQTPVFEAKDFTRDCVKARLVANAGDSGDTDTLRGNFGVLYQTADGNYVLMRFNGRGSVDEVWNLMNLSD